MSTAEEIVTRPDPRKFMYLPLSALHIDSNAQRSIRDSAVIAMVRGWDWRKVGVILIVLRGAIYYVIDGQHRTEAMRKLFPPDFLVMCCTVEAESISEEADLALAIDRSQHHMTRLQQWRQAVRAQHPSELAADEALTALGYSVGNGGGAGCINAPGAIAVIIGRFEDPKDGAAHLERIISILVAAYPDHDKSNLADRFNNHMLNAVDQLLRLFPRLEEHRLVDKMRRRPAIQWINWAKTTLDNTTTSERLARNLLQQYNDSLRTRRLLWPE